MNPDRDRFERWLDAYFDAWRTNDPADVAALFTGDATYWVGPFAEPWEGRDRIVAEWTAGHQADLEIGYQAVALEREVGVARWRVAARDPDGVRRERDGVLVLRFAPDGRCAEHREWFATRELPDDA